MDKIKINKEDVYKVEVNDNGEYIEFDLLDIELPTKIFNLSKELKKQTDFYNKKVAMVEKEFKNDPTMLFINKNKVDIDFCNKLRSEFDKVLGEGACQKIFGNVNRIGMFDDLFEQLLPIFSNIADKTKDIKERLVKRYEIKDKEVL